MAEEELNEQQELFEHYRYVVDPGQSLLRIDKYLSSRIENTSRTRIQNAANAGNILVNNSPVRPNYKVKPGDTVQIVLPVPPREIDRAARFFLFPKETPLPLGADDTRHILPDSRILYHNELTSSIQHQQRDECDKKRRTYWLRLYPPPAGHQV